MRHTDGRKINVGYDGSPQADAAVRWASREATLQECALQVVHAWVWPHVSHELDIVMAVQDGGLEVQAREVLEHGMQVARLSQPHLEVRGRLVLGDPYNVLRELSHTADMVVVGSRGFGRLRGFFAGAISSHLASTAASSVVVVKDHQPLRGPIAVGVDGSLAALQALNCAGDLAELWRTNLLVIYVQPGTPAATGYGRLQPALDDSATVLGDALAFAEAKGWTVDIREEAIMSHSIPDGLLDAATGCRLLVLGGTDHGVLDGLIGTTADTVLHHARTDVMIAHT